MTTSSPCERAFEDDRVQLDAFLSEKRMRVFERGLGIYPKRGLFGEFLFWRRSHSLRCSAY